MHAAATRDLIATERRRTRQLLAASGVDDPERWLARRRSRCWRTSVNMARAQPARWPAGAALRQRLQLAPGKAYAAVQSAHTRVLYILGFDGKMLQAGRAAGSTVPVRRRQAWLPGGLGDLDPRQAAAELAGRWLQRFGPATTVDLQWWMGWTVARTKQALADCGAVEAELDGGPGWLAADDPPLGPVEPWWQCCPGSTRRSWAGSSATGTFRALLWRCSTAPATAARASGWTGVWSEPGRRPRTGRSTPTTSSGSQLHAGAIDQRINELKSWIGTPDSR